MAVTIAGALEPALTLRISSKVQKRCSDVSCLTSCRLVFFLHSFSFRFFFFKVSRKYFLSFPNAFRTRHFPISQPLAPFNF